MQFSEAVSQLLVALVESVKFHTVRLRFPWGIVVKPLPLLVQSLTPREGSYLKWLLDVVDSRRYDLTLEDRELRAQKLLSLTHPQFSYPIRLTRAEKNARRKERQLWLDFGTSQLLR